jgi:hypothetical protein
MNRSILLFFSFFICLTTIAQVYPENFIIPIANQKVHGSLYKTIDFIDFRPEDGLLSKHPRNVTAIPIKNQLTDLLNSAIDSTAKNNGLLLELQLFNFTEITNAISDRGPCYLRARLYAKKGDRYQIINSVDTAVAIQKSANLSKQTLEDGGKILSSFIINNLTANPLNNNSYSLDEIQDMADSEKQQTILYTTSKYVNGLYYSYQSFIKQTPDKQIAVSANDTGKIIDVRIIENEKKTKIASKDVYAIVYEETPYIATKYGYYASEKRNGEFYFIGDIDVKGDPNDPLGGLTEEETFEMRIDYVNGKFVRLKRIQNEL